MLKLLVSFMFEYGNPPTPSMHASSLTMPNFRPSWHIYKKKSMLAPRCTLINLQVWFLLLELFVTVMFDDEYDDEVHNHYYYYYYDDDVIVVVVDDDDDDV